MEKAEFIMPTPAPYPGVSSIEATMQFRWINRKAQGVGQIWPQKILQQMYCTDRGEKTWIDVPIEKE